MFRQRIVFFRMAPLPNEEDYAPSLRARLRALWIRIVTFGVPLLFFLTFFFLSGLIVHASLGRLGLWLAFLGAGLAIGHLGRGTWRSQRRLRLERRRARA